MSAPLIEISGLKKHFPMRPDLLGRPRAMVYALDGVDLVLDRAETLSVVGESGCGKSTLGKALMRLIDPTAGEIRLDGERIDSLHGRRLKPFRRRVQIVFQDPFSSLNPRLTVFESLAEPLRNFGLAATSAALEGRIGELMDQVGLSRESVRRYPHEFSGGQRQRIAIARALAPRPDVMVCDEAVSALDVSVKAQIINLLCDIQKETGLALLFISHDLAIVEHLTHRAAVMYLGKVVESGSRRAIFGEPRHPYTQALMSAVPVPEPHSGRQRIVLKGDVPSPMNPPSGCRFHTRCPFVTDLCRRQEPALREIASGHAIACHYDDLSMQGRAQNAA